MARFRDYHFTLIITDERSNVIEGTIEDLLDYTFSDIFGDGEPFTKEEKRELLDDLIADIEAYKQKI